MIEENRQSQLNAVALQWTSGDDIQENLDVASRLLRQAKSKGAELAVLPENFGFTGKSERAKLDVAEQDGIGHQQDWAASIASELSLWLVAGTIPIAAEDNRVSSAACVYDADGVRRLRYDKIHLFDVELENGESYRESASIRPGDVSQSAIVETPWGKLAVATCYDLRFPELFRRFSEHDVVLVALPAAFTDTTGAAHWESLLRSRAIENQFAVLASGQVGRHCNGRKTWGHSMIIDAWGSVLDDAGSEPGFASGQIDFKKMMALRERFPVLQHRRL